MANHVTDWSGTNPAREPAAPLHFAPPQRLQGNLAPNTVMAAGDTYGCLVTIHGSGRVRVHAKITGGAGTLYLKYRLADHTTNTTVALATPATVALATGVENVLDIPNNPGYAYAEVGIIDGGGGATINFVDVIRTTESN